MTRCDASVVRAVSFSFVGDLGGCVFGGLFRAAGLFLRGFCAAPQAFHTAVGKSTCVDFGTLPHGGGERRAWWGFFRGWGAFFGFLFHDCLRGRRAALRLRPSGARRPLPAAPAVPRQKKINGEKKIKKADKYIIVAHLSSWLVFLCNHL